jgi:Zn-dependent M28 family amino/carboxypeptidase
MGFMKIRILLLILVLPFISKSQKVFDFSDTAVEHRIKKDLYILASDSFKGREAGTVNEIKARNYIIERFKEIGLTSIVPDSSFIQEFAFYDLERDSSVSKAFNVIGFINNGAKNTVVIGAHYDHLGTEKNQNANTPDIYYGADDNASGTVGVIEIARYLKANGSKNNNYIICTYSAEEKGLYGSEHFVNSKLFSQYDINYMLDFDMIGRLGAFGKVLYMNGVASSKIWRKLLRKNKPENFYIQKVPAGMDGSDDYPFYQHNIPVLFFITGLHKEYHTPKDTPDKINFSGETEIIKYAELLIDKIDSMGKIKFKSVTTVQILRSYMMYAKMFL